MTNLATFRVHIAPLGFEIDRIILPLKQTKADKPKKGDTAPTLTKNVVKKAGAKKAAKKAATGKAKKKAE